jgi:hypothetical protein
VIDAWPELFPYPNFSLAKDSARERTQDQPGKEKGSGTLFSPTKSDRFGKEWPPRDRDLDACTDRPRVYEATKKSVVNRVQARHGNVRQTDFAVMRSELGRRGFQAYLSTSVMLKTDMADDRS